MATNFLWGGVGTVVNLLTTELDSLVTAYGTAYGPEKGVANNYQMGMLHFHIASSSLAFTTASFVKVYFVPTITTLTGGTMPTYTSGATFKLAESNYLAATIAINPATPSAAVVDEVCSYVPIPLGFFKTILVSSLGVTLPSSGNTLNLYPTPSQY